ncbi:unannotated protein [freshwater metagenome]|uniref:Unannotated protein n=1 Tax=freshwater metagenome TaxID=449393 RepID=A0A6J6F9B6_9ZZZZ
MLDTAKATAIAHAVGDFASASLGPPTEPSGSPELRPDRISTNHGMSVTAANVAQIAIVNCQDIDSLSGTAMSGGTTEPSETKVMYAADIDPMCWGKYFLIVGGNDTLPMPEPIRAIAEPSARTVQSVARARTVWPIAMKATSVTRFHSSPIRLVSLGVSSPPITNPIGASDPRTARASIPSGTSWLMMS